MKTSTYAATVGSLMVVGNLVLAANEGVEVLSTFLGNKGPGFKPEAN